MFLLNMGCHRFDTMRYVLGADALSAQVLSWNRPWGWHTGDASHVALFELSRGVRAVHRAMGCSVGKKTGWSGDWRIDGPPHRSPRRVGSPLGEAPQGQEAVLAAWVAALRGGREPECSGRDNLATMAMTFAAIESVPTGLPVAVA